MENFNEPVDKIFVSNAGLAIVSVFLPKFFDSLGMLANGEFMDDEAATRATLLTQYIVSGESVFQEYGVVMNRIICGLEIEKPVAESIDITPKEAELTESLLYGVLRNWGGLGNTSVDALRESFLIRSGSLAGTDGSLTLWVEPRSYDMLLDTLPWSYSPIMLSWMKKQLYVEWR